MLQVLILMLQTLFPKYIDADTALLHASAAYDAEQETGVPATLLLSIAYYESRFNQFSFSRMECSGQDCTRVTGIWRQEKPPRKARPTFYCGVTQVGGWISWDQCREIMLDVPGSYSMAAEHLLSWMKDPACRRKRGDELTRCALMGYGGGYKAIEINASSYANRVMGTMRVFCRWVERNNNS
jgi:hypothetical protein